MFGRRGGVYLAVFIQWSLVSFQWNLVQFFLMFVFTSWLKGFRLFFSLFHSQRTHTHFISFYFNAFGNQQISIRAFSILCFVPQSMPIGFNSLSFLFVRMSFEVHLSVELSQLNDYSYSRYVFIKSVPFFSMRAFSTKLYYMWTVLSWS